MSFECDFHRLFPFRKWTNKNRQQQQNERLIEIGKRSIIFSSLCSNSQQNFITAVCLLILEVIPFIRSNFKTSLEHF